MKKRRMVVFERKIFYIIVFLILSISLFSASDSSKTAEVASIVPVTDGTSVTVFEQTGGIYQHTYTISTLLGSGGEFSTAGNEYYTVSSDGTYVKIHCYSPEHREGVSVGSNIVAVRLDGVPSFPEGLWASFIQELALGYNGIEESAMNALGPKDQIGPFLNSYCTYLGDQYSEIVVGFDAPTENKMQFKVIQGDNEWIVFPIAGTKSASSFYDYDSASGHTPFMESHVSKIYLHKDMISGELSLVFHQGMDNDTAGTMIAKYDFEGIPPGAYVSVSDDPKGIGSSPRSPGQDEFSLDLEPEAYLANTYNSDGGVLSGLPTTGSWAMTIHPQFISGINAWKYLKSDGTEIILEMNQCITIHAMEVTQPDLLVQDISFSNDLPEEGDQIVITATIANIGGTDATAEIEFYDGALVGQIGIPQSVSVLAGGTDVAQVNWIASPAGAHDIYVRIVNSNPSESDELNNLQSATILVGEALDFITLLPEQWSPLIPVDDVGKFKFATKAKLGKYLRIEIDGEENSFSTKFSYELVLLNENQSSSWYEDNDRKDLAGYYTSILMEDWNKSGNWMLRVYCKDPGGSKRYKVKFLITDSPADKGWNFSPIEKKHSDLTQRDLLTYEFSLISYEDPGLRNSTVELNFCINDDDIDIINVLPMLSLYDFTNPEDSRIDYRVFDPDGEEVFNSDGYFWKTDEKEVFECDKIMEFMKKEEDYSYWNFRCKKGVWKISVYGYKFNQDLTFHVVLTRSNVKKLLNGKIKKKGTKEILGIKPFTVGIDIVYDEPEGGYQLTQFSGYSTGIIALYGPTRASVGEDDRSENYTILIIEDFQSSMQFSYDFQGYTGRFTGTKIGKIDMTMVEALEEGCECEGNEECECANVDFSNTTADPSFSIKYSSEIEPPSLGEEYWVPVAAEIISHNYHPILGIFSSYVIDAAIDFLTPSPPPDFTDKTSVGGIEFEIGPRQAEYYYIGFHGIIINVPFVFTMNTTGDYDIQILLKLEISSGPDPTLWLIGEGFDMDRLTIETGFTAPVHYDSKHHGKQNTSLYLAKMNEQVQSVASTHISQGQSLKEQTQTFLEVNPSAILVFLLLLVIKSIYIIYVDIGV